MVRLTGLRHLFPMFGKSGNRKRGSNSDLPASSPLYKTVEVPDLNLKNLWLENSDPSLLQTTELLSEQTAALTLWAAEMIARVEALEARQQNER